MLMPVDKVRSTAVGALLAAGIPHANADILADALVEAELRGLPSHGLLRLPRVIDRLRNGVLNGSTTGSHSWTAQAFLSVDGEMGIGQVVAEQAITRITDRARTTGLAMASISNSNHIGMLALYAERVALEGQILIALTTSEALVHPWGGRTAMLGTNPITIGVPAEPHPFVMDMATGVVSMGKIHDYAHRELPLADGWALDGNGRPTTDAVAAKSGAIAPFGGAKGYALGLAFEVLVASLTNSATGRDVAGTLDATRACNKGDVFIVIQPSRSMDVVSEYLQLVRDSLPAEASRPVLAPGDRSRIRRAEALREGIDVAEEVWDRILELADNFSMRPNGQA